MRHIVQEIAFQIVLRNCSKEVGGEGQYIYKKKKFEVNCLTMLCWFLPYNVN